jgi:hypothetical protein
MSIPGEKSGSSVTKEREGPPIPLFNMVRGEFGKRVYTDDALDNTVP